MNKNTELRRAALKIIEGRKEKDIHDTDLDDSDSRYTTVWVDNANYRIYMVGNNECFDLNEFYQYGITDDNHILKFYFALPENLDDLGDVDYDHAYRAVDVTKEWESTDLGDFLGSAE